LNRPSNWRENSRDGFQQRRLAGTIRAEESHEAAASQREIEAL
jgi:hypothetical protein